MFILLYAILGIVYARPCAVKCLTAHGRHRIFFSHRPMQARGPMCEFTSHHHYEFPQCLQTGTNLRILFLSLLFRSARKFSQKQEFRVIKRISYIKKKFSQTQKRTERNEEFGERRISPKEIPKKFGGRNSQAHREEFRRYFASMNSGNTAIKRAGHLVQPREFLSS